MSYTPSSRRFRGTKKRLKRIRWSVWEKWLAIILFILLVLSANLGAWIARIYKE